MPSGSPLPPSVDVCGHFSCAVLHLRNLRGLVFLWLSTPNVHSHKAVDELMKWTSLKISGGDRVEL